MTYAHVSLLLLLVGGCAKTISAQPPSPSVPVQASAHCDLVADGLERYPFVELRSDLGEVPMPGEQQLVEKAMRAVEEVITLRAKDKNNIGRGDHAKPLGCYRAKFTVSPQSVVPPEAQAGIAKRENLGRTFDAVVRFSNSEPKDVPDFRSATVGLAIKVYLDPKTHSKDEFFWDGSAAEQDFVAGGLRTFVSSNITDYADLFELRIHPIAHALSIMDRHPEAYRVFGKEPLLRVFNPSPSAAPVVLEGRFSSLLPYAWGHLAVKYRFEPCDSFDRSQASFSRFDAGYQAKVVTDFLSSNDICYLMTIQARPRPASDEIERAFPIDDAKVYWPDEPEGTDAKITAAFREVAQIRIERGTKAIDAEICERMAFNPWNGLRAHQPLGSLSRARLAVYKKSECVRTKIYQSMPEQSK